MATLMFQDSSNEIVSFPSSWKKDKLNSDTTTQTSEVLTYETSTQSLDQYDIAVQTEVEEVKQHHKLVVDNSSELREFLLKVEPMVTAALKRNTESHAFDGYKVEWEEETTEVNLIHTLQYLPYKEYHCTGISWNCTGSVIATCYGRFDHNDWCSHKSALCTWNIDRRSLDPTKPDIIAECPTCLMSLSFHPSLPSVIAVGGFSGEVRILNTANDGDPLVASSDLVDVSHKEPIAQLSWLSKSKGHSVISLGNDGKLLVWDWKSTKLEVIQTFSLSSTGIPSNLRVGKSDIATELGGTCMSFSSEDSSIFVVGCENGSLMKCSIDAHFDTIPSAFSTRYAFKPHHGPVYALSCAPFHRNLFLSCGIDSTARLYSLLESNPLLTLEPGKGYLFAITWSPTRPLIVALGTAQGEVLIYDLKSSHITPKVTLQVCEKKPVYCIKYNPHRPMILATGDANGTIKVYRLNSELTQQTNREVEQLASFAKDLSFDNS